MPHDLDEQPGAATSGTRRMAWPLPGGGAPLLMELGWSRTRATSCPPAGEIAVQMVQQELSMYAARRRGRSPERLANLERSRAPGLSQADSQVTPLIYQRLPDGGPTEGDVLISLGADGAPGGDHEDTEVAYWALVPTCNAEPPPAPL